MSQALRRSRAAPKRGLKVVSSCVFRSCVCVSKELADSEVHDAAPLDVVSVHWSRLQSSQDTEPCVCVLEFADNEIVDSLPRTEVVECVQKLLLERCECVCHVCHVFVCICERHRGESNPSLHHVCLCRCVTWWDAIARTASSPCISQMAQ